MLVKGSLDVNSIVTPHFRMACQIHNHFFVISL